ncbi:MAG: ferrous iron transport protein A [Clostridia bacterium]|nr:ferrous iron transport protein A [Clostridia bacterium]MEE1055182.1 FeoA family protein [Acutalibacteraceae bacterium]
MKYLCDLEVGQSCIVSEILTRGSMRRRFLDIGLIENTVVKCVGQSPSGDPKAYLIRGAVIAIRSDDSGEIIVREEK